MELTLNTPHPIFTAQNFTPFVISEACMRFIEQVTSNTTPTPIQPAGLSEACDGATVARVLTATLSVATGVHAASQSLFDALCALMPASSWNDVEESIERLHTFSQVFAPALILTASRQQANCDRTNRG